MITLACSILTRPVRCAIATLLRPHLVCAASQISYKLSRHVRHGLGSCLAHARSCSIFRYHSTSRSHSCGPAFRKFEEQ
jgi:hypothetical protein